MASGPLQRTFALLFTALGNWHQVLPSEHTLKHSGAGTVLCWGTNLQHQCSQDSTPDLPAPTPVKPLQGLHIVAVAAGNSHTLALSDAGDVYAWGANDCGQLGINTTGSRARFVASPQLIEHLGQDSPVIDISCGTRCASSFCTGWLLSREIGGFLRVATERRA